ncbi:hypothetical protein BH11BAC7_BH11BAC7_25150 [soil metagenome]
MIIEQLTYRTNHQDFLAKMQEAVVDRLVFLPDEDSTFEKEGVPFSFRYCSAVIVYSDKGNFKLHTCMADNGLETLWLSPAEEEVNTEATFFIPVNAQVKTIHFSDGHEGYPFRLQIEFERTNIFLYAADIHRNDDDSYKYMMNDEMILAFEDEDEAKRFETLVGYQSKS